jgi:hypothetical protein
MVGCQVGGDYKCNLLYLVARRCVHMVGVLRGTTILKPQCHTGWGRPLRFRFIVCQSGIPGFLWGREKICGEWSVSKVWPSILTWGCNNGTYVWLAGVLRRSRSSVMLCEFSNHLLYIQSRGVASASVFMCGSLIVTLFFLICPNLFCSHNWHL